MRAPTPTESRALAWLLALLALALAYLLLVHWWFTAPLLATRAQMRELRVQQQRFAGLIAQRPALQARLAGLDRTRNNTSAFLPETDPNAASVGLMQRAVDAVSAHASLGPCQVTQKMPLARAPDAQPWREVSASISMQCAIAPLAAVLYDLEKGKPYLFIDSFGIYRNQAPTAGATQPPLQVQMTLSGYLRSSAGGTP